MVKKKVVNKLLPGMSSWKVDSKDSLIPPNNLPGMSSWKLDGEANRAPPNHRVSAPMNFRVNYIPTNAQQVPYLQNNHSLPLNPTHQVIYPPNPSASDNPGMVVGTIVNELIQAFSANSFNRPSAFFKKMLENYQLKSVITVKEKEQYFYSQLAQAGVYIVPYQAEYWLVLRVKPNTSTLVDSYRQDRRNIASVKSESSNNSLAYFFEALFDYYNKLSNTKKYVAVAMTVVKATYLSEEVFIKKLLGFRFISRISSQPIKLTTNEILWYNIKIEDFYVAAKKFQEESVLNNGALFPLSAACDFFVKWYISYRTIPYTDENKSRTEKKIISFFLTRQGRQNKKNSINLTQLDSLPSQDLKSLGYYEEHERPSTHSPVNSESAQDELNTDSMFFELDDFLASDDIENLQNDPVSNQNIPHPEEAMNNSLQTNSTNLTLMENIINPAKARGYHHRYGANHSIGVLSGQVNNQMLFFSPIEGLPPLRSTTSSTIFHEEGNNNFDNNEIINIVENDNSTLGKRKFANNAQTSNKNPKLTHVNTHSTQTDPLSDFSEAVAELSLDILGMDEHYDLFAGW